MIGQENLLKKLSSFTIDNLPHSLLLLGERGSFQKEVSEWLADRFNLDLFDLTKLTDFNEFISTIGGNPIPTLYTINLLEFNDPKDSKQNTLLKLVEEPNSYSYIFIYGENNSQIIDTLRNRSYIIQSGSYSRDDLLPLITGDVEMTLGICNTPGQVEVANNTDLKYLNNLCDNIIDNIKVASLPNTLSISNKINFSDEYNKLDLFLFIRCLGNKLTERTIRSQSYQLVYLRLLSMQKKIWLVRDKKQQFENFLINMWLISREISLQ